MAYQKYNTINTTLLLAITTKNATNTDLTAIVFLLANCRTAYYNPFKGAAVS